MKLEKKHYLIIAVVVAIIAVWYFFLRKKKVESNYSESLRTLDANLPMIGNESNFINKDKSRDKTKVCNCAYLNKPNKICSYSVNCNLCCEGAGTSGQEFVANNNPDINGMGLLDLPHNRKLF